MTIAKTKEGVIKISRSGWGQETPAVLRKITNYILALCAFWAVFQDTLPFGLSDVVKEAINRWAVFIPLAYRFFIQWAHIEDKPTYGNFNTDKFGKN